MTRIIPADIEGDENFHAPGAYQGESTEESTSATPAPDVFTPDEVASLMRWQSGTIGEHGPGIMRGMPIHVHPFTCPNRGDGRHRFILSDLGPLIPTVRGWICPFCDYTQDWAHASMKALPAEGLTV